MPYIYFSVCTDVFMLLYCCVQTLYALNIPVLTSVVRQLEECKIDATSQIPPYSEISTLCMRISLLLVDDLIIVSNHTVESKPSVFMFSVLYITLVHCIFLSVSNILLICICFRHFSLLTSWSLNMIVS